MKAANTKFESVEEYLSAFPQNIRGILEKLRKTIQQAAPQAEELISYNMPAFKLHGSLVFYAAYKNHIGFYPSSSGVKVFKKYLTAFKTSKGAIQFPIDKALPLALVKDIVKYRVKENLEKARIKEAKKNLRICKRGHKYYKSSDCPVCPLCEQEGKPETGFFALIGAPARRALEREGLNTLLKLSKVTEDEILALHGMGPGTLPKLRSALKEKGLSFKK